MKKRLLMTLMTLLMLITCAIGLAACSEDQSSDHTHSMTHHAAIAATCTENGAAEYWSCSECNKNFSDADGKNEIEDIVIPALGHDWSEWEILTPATCTEDGSREHVCNRCHAEENESIPAAGHTYVNTPGKEATCTEDGVTAGKYCSVCEEVFEEVTVLPALGHNFVDGKCTRCGEKQPVTEGLDFTLSSDKTYYTLTGIGNTTETDIYIPAQYQNLPVKAISKSAFEKNTKIASVSIPDSVISIGEKAFYYCSNLAKVQLGAGVESIGEYAFYACTGLTELHIPASVTDIAAQAFSYCYNVAEITADADNSVYAVAGNCLYTKADKTLVYGCKASVIPADGTVTSIGDYAFYGCGYLKSINIPDSVESIGDYAFYSCTNLAEVTLGEGVLYINNHSFRKCTNLKTISMPGVKSIGSYAFQGCTKLAEANLPAIEKLFFDCFDGCSALKKLTIGKNMQQWYDCLGGCNSLNEIVFLGSITDWCSVDFRLAPFQYADVEIGGAKLGSSLVIPEGVTNIPSDAFAYARTLNSVTLPSSLTKIESGAFGDCFHILEICNKSSLNITAGSSDFGGIASYALYVGSTPSGNLSVTEDGYIVYSDGTLNVIGGYTGARSTLVLPDTIKGKTYTINKFAFSDVPVLSVTIPSGCTEIVKNAFINNTYLKTAVINGVKVIGESAFSGCTQLTSLTLGEGIVTIERYAFDCYSMMAGAEKGKLTSLVIPDSVQEIGIGAFEGHINLTTVTIGSGVTHIGKNAFRKCTALAQVTFKKTSGWKVEENDVPANYTSVTLGNAAQNATLLRDTYMAYHWRRG